MSESPQTPQASKTSALAIVSLVFGILAWIALPLVGAVVASVCGRIGLREIRNAPAGTMQGEGMAKAGQILAYLQYALLLILIALFCWTTQVEHAVYLNFPRPNQ